MPSHKVICEMARAAANDGIYQTPDLIRKSAHPDCRDVDFHFIELVSLYDQRRELAAHKIRPEDIMGSGATHDEVEGYITISIDYHASAIAWGDTDDI